MPFENVIGLVFVGILAIVLAVVLSTAEENSTNIVAYELPDLGSHSGSNPSDFSRILASAFDSLDSEASRVFRRLLSVRRSYHEQDKEQVFT